MRAVIMWSGDMLAALQRLRAGGVPMLRCEVELGVSCATVFRKCQELGIAGGRDRGCADDAEDDGLTTSTRRNLAAIGVRDRSAHGRG